MCTWEHGREEISFRGQLRVSRIALAACLADFKGQAFASSVKYSLPDEWDHADAAPGHFICDRDSNTVTVRAANGQELVTALIPDLVAVLVDVQALELGYHRCPSDTVFRSDYWTVHLGEGLMSWSSGSSTLDYRIPGFTTQEIPLSGLSAFLERVSAAPFE